MSEPKTKGVSFLVRAIGAQKRTHGKFVVIPMDKAEEIVNEASGQRVGDLSPKSNTARGCAYLLGVSVPELCERMNGKTPKQYHAEIAELKSKMKQLEEIGDRMATDSPENRMAWARAKTFG
jgi:hypothetical protein